MNRHYRPDASSRGFTLVEILIVIGMLAILTTIVLVAVNPLRQFAQARNSQRQANVSALLNAVSNRVADNRGVFEGEGCPPLPTEHTLEIASLDENYYDLRDCLVPNYIPEMPFDPALGFNECTTTECSGPGERYSTEYTIQQDSHRSRITICAPLSMEQALPGSKRFCLTR